jgi:hypothetical protein
MDGTMTKYNHKLEAFLAKGPFVKVDFGMFIQKNDQWVWQSGDWSKPDISFSEQPPCAVCGSNKGAWRMALQDSSGTIHYVAHRCLQKVPYKEG